MQATYRPKPTFLAAVVFCSGANTHVAARGVLSVSGDDAAAEVGEADVSRMPQLNDIIVTFLKDYEVLDEQFARLEELVDASWYEIVKQARDRETAMREMRTVTKTPWSSESDVRQVARRVCGVIGSGEGIYLRLSRALRQVLSPGQRCGWDSLLNQVEQMLDGDRNAEAIN